MNEQIKNNSPWLRQIERKRPLVALYDDLKTDVAIIGGGIAGISTAYFILRDTNSNVVLVEADEVAHGATGHNAGQVVSYFERPFHEIVAEFGLKMAHDGLEAVKSAWGLLDAIYEDAGIKTPFVKFVGYAGCTSLSQVLTHLKNNAYRIQSGLSPQAVFISEETDYKTKIPQEYAGHFSVVPAEKIMDLLETHDRRFIAALGSLKGCMNSALFTEEVAEYLTERYPDRFALFEHTPIEILRLHRDNADLVASNKHSIQAKRAILCTNGFEYIRIENTRGPDINSEFHHMIKGSIGYMAAYLDPHTRPPSAISYFPLETSDQKKDAFRSSPYFYLTRRLYYTAENENPSLVCIGGPEQLIDDTTQYSKDHPYPEEAKADMDQFLRDTYRHLPAEKKSYEFLWHGLMGYTPNGIRRVGPEPCNPVLHYNLGCNGVGILPSIYGGQRIAWILRGDKLPASIFDVPHMHGSEKRSI